MVEYNELQQVKQQAEEESEGLRKAIDDSVKQKATLSIQF